MTTCSDCGVRLEAGYLYHSPGSVGCLKRQLAKVKAKNKRLQAIVDKLPVFADTQQPFIPANIVEVWTVMGGKLYTVKPLCRLGFAWCNGPYYSTKEAAEAAGEKT